MERCATLATGLSQQKRSFRKVEGGKPHFCRYPSSTGSPPEASGNHEVDQQKQIVFEFKDNPLATSMNLEQQSTIYVREWRLGCS
jgi:hypothetical protein